MQLTGEGTMIKDGDVFTFAGDWMTSRLIRAWTGQKVSHVGFALWLRFGIETENRLCVLESMEPGGIRVMPLALVMADCQATYHQSLDTEQVNAHEAIGWALTKWGGKYASWLQFVSLMSPAVRRFRERVGLPVQAGGGYHCSGLVTAALAFGGYRPEKDPSLTTPGDLWDFKCLDAPRLLEL